MTLMTLSEHSVTFRTLSDRTLKGSDLTSRFKHDRRQPPPPTTPPAIPPSQPSPSNSRYTREDIWHLVTFMTLSETRDDIGHLVTFMTLSESREDIGYLVTFMTLSESRADIGHLVTFMTLSERTFGDLDDLVGACRSIQ